jgi:hypothetical protein
MSDTSAALNTPIRRKSRRPNPPLNKKGDLLWGKKKEGDIRQTKGKETVSKPGDGNTKKRFLYLRTV